MPNFLFRWIRRVLRGPTDDERLAALRRRGLKMGSNCSVMPGVILDPSHCWHIELGNDVTLAPNVLVLAHDASMKRHLGFTRIGKVHIGSRVFVGACSVILPGVSIGDDSIIGAGSVVSRSIPARVVAVGNPARVVCSLDEFLARHRHFIDTLPVFDEEYTVRRGVTTAKKQDMNQRMDAGVGYVV